MDKAIVFALLLYIITVFSQGCGNFSPVLGYNSGFFNLSDESNQAILNDSNLTGDEKFYLLFHNTIGDSPLIPSVESYDAMMEFPCAPYDAETYDKNYIKDAWVRVITAVPTVHYGNYSWSLPRGSVIVAYGYNVTIPRSATNVFPDCGPTYALLSSSSNISTHANGAYIGRAGAISYDAGNASNLTVEGRLEVSARVRKNLYEDYCLCCSVDKNGICASLCCACEFSSTIYDEETLSISDFLHRQVYGFDAQPNLTMLSCPDEILGTASGNFSLNTAGGYQSFYLKFKSAYLNVTSGVLDIHVTELPYKVLELEFREDRATLAEGVYIPEVVYSKNSTLFNFTSLFYSEAQNITNANSSIVDLFGMLHGLSNETPINCPKSTELALASGNLAREGEELQVKAALSSNGSPIAGRKISLLYGGLASDAYTDSKGEAAFEIKADANSTLIEAIFNYDGEYAAAYARKAIFVYAGSSLQQTAIFIAFFLLIFLTYAGIKIATGRWDV